MGVQVTLNTRGLDRLVARLGDRVDAFVRVLAFKVEAATKRHIKAMDAVDTGYMLGSVRVFDKQIGDGEAEVVVGATYGIHVHEGAKGRKPRRFLTAGVREVEGEVQTLALALAAKMESDAQ